VTSHATACVGPADPGGIPTDYTTKHFFGDLSEKKNAMAILYDILRENRADLNSGTFLFL
jgi:hypothetical protein